MKTVSIGKFKEDGTFIVVCTLNNNGGLVPEPVFEALVERTALGLSAHLGEWETVIMERQDAPDYVDME